MSKLTRGGGGVVGGGAVTRNIENKHDDWRLRQLHRPAPSSGRGGDTGRNSQCEITPEYCSKHDTCFGWGDDIIISICGNAIIKNFIISVEIDMIS